MTHAYIGTKPCGCTVAATVIKPEWAKDTAKTIADWVKRGYSVDRVEVGDARLRLKSCDCPKPAKPSKTLAAVGTMFDAI